MSDHGSPGGDGAALVEQITVLLNDQASAPIAKIGAAFGVLGTSVTKVTDRISHSLKHMVSNTAAQLGVGLGLHSIAHHAWEASKEFGAVTKAVARANFAFQGWNKTLGSGERMKIAKKEATEVVESLDEIEDRLATPLSELGEAYSKVAGPAFGKLGLKQKEVIELTEQAAVASKVYGVSTQQAAMTFMRLLEYKRLPRMGSDPLSVHLNQTMGNFKKLKPEQIFHKLQTVMKDLGPAAAEMSQGLTDNMFRLKNMVEKIYREASGPAFKAVTQQLKVWREQIEHSFGSMKNFGQVVGEKVVEGLKLVVNLTEALVKHWKEIAWVIGSIKVAGWLTSGAGAMAGMAGGIIRGAGGAQAAWLKGGLTGAMVKLEPQFAALAGSIGPVIVGMGALAMGLQHLVDAILDDQARIQKAALSAPQTMASLHTGMNALWDIKKGDIAGGEKKLRGMYAEMGVEFGGKLPMEQMYEQLRAMAPELAAKVLTDQGIKGVTAESIQVGSGVQIKEALLKILPIYEKLALKFLEPGEGEKKIDPHKSDKRKGDNNFFGDIHITQDFKDQDPDRVFIAFKNDLENSAVRPRMAANSLADGE